MIILNSDEQEAAAEFIGMMKRLQVELDDASIKFAAFQASAERAAGHCAEHAGKLPDHPTSQLKTALSQMAEFMRSFDASTTDTITDTVNDFGRVIRGMELEVRKGKH
jgi:hypothetical protein